MAKRLQLRRGTTAQHSTFTGAEGEVTVDTDKDTIILHDGTTVGGIEMARNSSIDSLTTTPINTAIDNANFDIVGGGTITVNATGNVLWNSPFVLRGNGYGSHFSTDGYFNIQCPTSGTIIGVGGAANITATSNGILLNANESLYFIIPIGSNGATGSNSTMFRIVGNTSALVIPSNWIKIATRYNSSYVEFINGTSLRLNTSLNTDSYDILGSDVSGAVSSANQLTTARTINGVSFNGSANINIENRLGTAIASATTTTIGTAGLGDYIHITGTTTITSFGTASTAGIRRTLIFDGVLTLTHNATSLICPGGANITTVVGTIIEVVAESTTSWRVVSVTHPSVGLTEIGYLGGVTSGIQTQLNGKQATITGGATTIASADLTSSRALISDTAGKVSVSAVTSAEIGYLGGVTSGIQTQLNTKAPLASPAFTGTPTSTTPNAGDNSERVATTAFVLANSLQDISFTAGTKLEALAASEVYFFSTTYIKRKEISVGTGGTITVSFRLKSELSTAYGQIYVNDVAVGTVRTTTSRTYVTYTQNITVAAGDLVQLYVKGGYSDGYAFADQFKILVAAPSTSTVLLN